MESSNIVAEGAKIAESAKLGHHNVIGNAEIGENVVLGHGCIVEDGVRIGAGTVMKNNVELRTGVEIGEDCYVDSGVTCTGDARIGNRVTLRNYVVIARGCILEDDSFVAPQVMFNNLSVSGEAVGGAHVGKKCFIGTQSVMGAGISICDGAIVGSCAMVTHDITEEGTYIGVPAKRVK